MLQKQLRSVVTVALLAAPTMLLASEADAAKSNFWIRNDSSYTIQEVYLSESNYDIWGRDLLGSNLLYSGGYFQVAFGNPSPNACLYDIRAISTEGHVLEDYGVNVCTSDYYTFFDR